MEKNLRFCGTVYTTPHKNAQKRRFQNRSPNREFTNTDVENGVRAERQVFSLPLPRDLVLDIYKNELI